MGQLGDVRVRRPHPLGCEAAFCYCSGMPKLIDLRGRRQGALTVAEPLRSSPRGTVWRVRCDCGAVIERTTADLCRARRPAQSCGCRRLIGNLGRRWKHGQSKRAHQPASPTYVVWAAMKARCENSESASFKDYGARGITICREWSASFEAFLRDMGERPDGLTLDRIDGAQGYRPGNCRWATLIEQNTNRRGVLVVDGLSLKGYAAASGIPYSSLNRAVKAGEEPHAAVARLRLCARPGARGPRTSATGRASPRT